MEADTRAHGGSATVVDPVTGRLLDGRYRIGAAHRPRRHGQRLRGTRHPARPHLRGQGHASRPRRRRRSSPTGSSARPGRPPASTTRTSSTSSTRATTPRSTAARSTWSWSCVPGHTLRDVIRDEAPMPPAKALALIEPIVSALAAAHRAGLIHRDIKPENVLIADEESGGRVKVADFGLAKAVSADTQHTATGGVIIGTVSYLAPELVDRRHAATRAPTCTPRAWCSTSCSPARSRTRASPRSRSPTGTSTRTCRRRRVVAPGVPPYVDALVARATSRDRDQRPADAGVLLHQLHRVSQALAAGVWDDAELAADLAPARRSGRRPHRRPPSRSRSVPSRPRAGRREAPRPTPSRTAADRPDRSAGGRRPPTPRPLLEPQPLGRTDPREPPVPRRAHPRQPRALAVGARCSSSSRWLSPWPPASAPTGSAGRATPRPPASSGSASRPPPPSSTTPASTSKIGRAGVLRGRRRRATSSPPTRHPGARVLDHGTVTLTHLARQGALRRPEGRPDDRRPGPGRAAASST